MDARNKGALTLTFPSDRELVLIRTFEAPRALVFAAWTRPEHVRHWYGCGEMTLAACEIDLRVGGAYRFVLRGPDGVEHTIRGVYREIAAPDRLSCTEQYVTAGFTSGETFVTVTFVERNGRTTLTSTVLHQSRAERDGHLNSVEGGASQVFDRLAEHLQTLRADGAAREPERVE